MSNSQLPQLPLNQRRLQSLNRNTLELSEKPPPNERCLNKDYKIDHTLDTQKYKVTAKLVIKHWIKQCKLVKSLQNIPNELIQIILEYFKPLLQLNIYSKNIEITGYPMIISNNSDFMSDKMFMVTNNIGFKKSNGNNVETLKIKILKSGSEDLTIGLISSYKTVYTYGSNLSVHGGIDGVVVYSYKAAGKIQINECDDGEFTLPVRNGQPFGKNDICAVSINWTNSDFGLMSFWKNNTKQITDVTTTIESDFCKYYVLNGDFKVHNEVVLYPAIWCKSGFKGEIII